MTVVQPLYVHDYDPVSKMVTLHTQSKEAKISALTQARLKIHADNPDFKEAMQLITAISPTVAKHYSKVNLWHSCEEFSFYLDLVKELFRALEEDGKKFTTFDQLARVFCADKNSYLGQEETISLIFYSLAHEIPPATFNDRSEKSVYALSNALLNDPEVNSRASFKIQSHL